MTQSHFPPIQYAQLDWQTVDGVDIPLSKSFGDVYFSKDNGLLETRHVFLNGNDLSERLAQLTDRQRFIVAETGFGTGLNFLALWQLWQQVRPDNHSHLHFISLEKFPLKKADLQRALTAWQELQPLAQQLIKHYPLPLAGCHRLYFAHERITLDLWLGDAQDMLPLIHSSQPVDAWFLDGFAPSCNPELWQEQIFRHIMRLSGNGTTFVSFSVAGVLKRALKAYDVTVSRPKGFGHKREMLKAVWQAPSAPQYCPPSKPQYIAVVGAGIAGLNCAWHLAQRGIQVTLFDKQHPLAGGSGNPLAMLNPKLAPLQQAATHLMTVSWQYALAFYAQFSAFRPMQIYQIGQEKYAEQQRQIVHQYPDDILQRTNDDTETGVHALLKYAGALSPHQFAEQVLAHPQITWQHADIQSITPQAQQVILIDQQQRQHLFDHVILCNALDLQTLLPQTAPLKAIRGQVSWAKTSSVFQQQDLHIGYSYSGYCMPLDEQHLIFGASFLPQQTATDIRRQDHQHNYDLLNQTLPQYAQQLEEISQWQGRAALRAQTADYLPLAGRLADDSPISVLAGLGSKGFLFAPLCAEMIACQICHEPLPVPQPMVQFLNPLRFKPKVPKK